MTDNVDRSKRRLLLAATTAAGGVAAAGVATPFVMSFMPSERAKAAGAPVEVDISTIAPGTMKVVEWQGKPVWVVTDGAYAKAPFLKPAMALGMTRQWRE